MSFAKRTFVWLLGATLFAPAIASANFTFEGYLTLLNGTPVTGATTLSIKVLSPGTEACILFAEDHTATLPADGYVSLPIGGGTHTGGIASLSQAFENSGTLAGLTCNSGSTYTPAAGDKRKLNIRANGEDLGLIDLNPLPAALSAEKVGAFASSNLMRVEAAGSPQPTTPFTPAQFSELNAIIGGTTSQYLRNNPTNGAGLPVVTGAPASPAVGSIWYDSGSSQVKFYNGVSAITLSAGGAGTVSNVSSSNSDITVATSTTTPTLTLNTGIGPSQIVKLDAAAKLPAVDGSMLTNVNTTNLNGHPLSAPSPSPGQVLKYSGSTWTGSNLSATDITSGTVQIGQGGTGAASFAANSVIVSNAVGSALLALNCAAGQTIKFDVSGYAVCGNESVLEGGNSTGVAMSIGTKSVFPLNFISNNIVRATISPAGNVGIGTTTPTAKLEVVGSIVSQEYIGSSAIADFSMGNTVVFTTLGGSSLTLQNMVPGGHYTIVIEDPTSRAYTFGGACGTSKFSPANVATTVSSSTIYNIYFRGSGTCYIDWKSGYN